MTLHLPPWAQRRAPAFWFGLRTALAVVLAIGVALAMDWQRPEWAGIAVISISQDSEAATLGKGRLRLAATLGAAICAITLIAVFPQDRWGFFAALSLYVGLCGYHMLASRHGYAWRVAAYVCPVIAISAGSVDSVNDFSTALERCLENLTGVAAIVLIAVLAGSRGNPRQFARYVTEITGHLADLIGQVVEGARADGQGGPVALERFAELRTALGRFDGLLMPAMDESARIAHQSGGWWQVRHRFADLLDDLAAWRLSLARPGAVSSGASLDAHCGEALALQRRLRGIAGAAPNQPAATAPATAAVMPALVAGGAAARLPAAGDSPQLLLAMQHLRRIEACITALEALIRQLDSDPRDQARIPAPPPAPWTLNPDHLKVAVRLALGIWIAALLWIYVPDLPGGVGLITLTAVFSAVLALAGMRAQQLLPAVLIALLSAGIVYVTVLPMLEGYTQLALLLIVYIVTVFVVTGEQRSLRTLSIDFMLITFGITNQQSFSFIGFLDRTVAIVVACGIIALLQEVPWSSSPDRQYLEVVRRLRRTVAAMHGLLRSPALPRAWWQRIWCRQRLVFLREELRRLPVSLDRISHSAMFRGCGHADEVVAAVNQAGWSAAFLMLELLRLGGPSPADPLAPPADPVLRAVTRGLMDSRQQLALFHRSLRRGAVTIPSITASR